MKNFASVEGFDVVLDARRDHRVVAWREADIAWGWAFQVDVADAALAHLKRRPHRGPMGPGEADREG